jgi:ribosome modulation factor
MPRPPDSLEECFKQGVDARQEGRKPGDNPYRIDTDEHREWTAGWKATPDLDEDEDPASTRISVAGTDDVTGSRRDPDAD